MKVSFKKLVFFALTILTNTQFCSGQPIYNIPWANVQPKFVFPIYFEEASGMKDTVYFCYDPQADIAQPNIADTNFGQKLIQIDTTKFYAYFANGTTCSSCDSQYKVSVAPLSSGLDPSFPNNLNIIAFHNGSLPLKITWDILTTYSDSLPFNASLGLPKCQGQFQPISSAPSIIFGENGTYWPASGLPFNILVTDTGGPALKDSCTVLTVNGGGPFEVENFAFSLYFDAWTGSTTSINSPQVFSDQIIYNSSTHELKFITDRIFNSCKIHIIDIYGREVTSFSQKMNNINSNFLNVNNGLYFALIEVGNLKICKLFIAAN